MATSKSLFCLKLTLIGEAKSGKTSIVNRFFNDQFEEAYDPTFGLSPNKELIERNGTKYGLLVWDIAGNKFWEFMIRDCFEEAHGILLIYDVTNRNSFLHVSSWGKRIEKESKNRKTLLVVGNKCDLEKEREVSFDEGKQLADSLDATFIEVSAQNSHNISSLFEIIISQAIGMNKLSIFESSLI
ncbi:rab1_5 [Blepharisma stoltei]|uniref:GTP-binding protein n=1 Tax=Blepharisma stoltei TaxID=1481888 RepID=A0AAU9J3G4_9CILI|nr:unnamed protein product [Blepharisma stoltei]